MQAFTLKSILTVAALGTMAAYIGVPDLQSPLVMDQEPETAPSSSASDDVLTDEELAEPTPEFGAAGQFGQWESFQEMHARYTEAFVESEGFGISRVMTFEDPGRKHLPIDGLAYAMSKMQLIGLSQGSPVAYIPSWLNVQRSLLEKYETRDLTDFEMDSVERFALGESLTWQFRDNRSEVTLVGALRAEQSCVECHQVGEGELLGAFVYTLRKTEPHPTFEVSRPQNSLGHQDASEHAALQRLAK